MRITILTWGTRGEVQPYVALGMGLQQAGHSVCIASHTIFQELIVSRGLEFSAIAGDPREWTQRQRAREVVATRNPVRFMREALKLLNSLLEDTMVDSLKACQDTDAIIYSAMAWPGYNIAEKLGVPCCQAMVSPYVPTREFPSPLISPKFSLGKTYNKLTHLIAQQMGWLPIYIQLNHLRQKVLGLSPLPLWGPMPRLVKCQMPCLFGYSSRFLPKPADWPEWTDVTGYWFLDHLTDWQPPAGLVDFLAAGSPPIFIGFGAMSSPEPRKTTDIIVEALAKTKQRGILQPGWGGLSNNDLPENIRVIDDIPFDWLFPRMAAVVHHGGSGTTAIGLREGIPTVVLPFMIDQFFFGNQVHRLGVGPSIIPQKRLTADRLAAAIEIAVYDENMRRTAKELGKYIKAERGVEVAVEILERRFAAREGILTA